MKYISNKITDKIVSSKRHFLRWVLSVVYSHGEELIYHGLKFSIILTSCFHFGKFFTLFLMIFKFQASNKLRDIIQIDFLLFTGTNKKYTLIAY